MFRIIFDNHQPVTVDADNFEISAETGWLLFTKGGLFVTSAREVNIIMVEQVDA